MLHSIIEKENRNKGKTKIVTAFLKVLGQMLGEIEYRNRFVKSKIVVLS